MNLDKVTASGVYTVDPNVVKFGHLVYENSRKSYEEMRALTEGIKKFGQLDPIIVRNGLCEDGWHRVESCKELGIDVRCVDVSSELDDKDLILITNKNTFTSRNDTATQKAIKAYNLTKKYKYTDKEALLNTGIPLTSNIISIVRYIDKSRIGREMGLLDKLVAGEAITINGKTTKSIEVTKKELVKLEMKEITPVEIGTVKPDTVIDYKQQFTSSATETRFWELYSKYNLANTDVGLKLEIINMLNMLHGFEDGYRLDNEKTSSDE